MVTNKDDSATEGQSQDISYLSLPDAQQGSFFSQGQLRVAAHTKIVIIIQRTSVPHKALVCQL
jgi:hypothetical protein